MIQIKEIILVMKRFTYEVIVPCKFVTKILFPSNIIFILY